jgi:6-phosphogluconolactonase
VSVRFEVLPSRAALAEAAADRIVAAARNAIRRRGRCVLALSGGSTPRLVYPLLAAPPLVAKVDWRRVEFFWGDERAVPANHPESNFGLARALLLDHLPGVRADAVHRMPADASDRESAARDYEAELGRLYDITPTSARRPSLDLIWLGMGPDGHTASLFPGSDSLTERRRWVLATTAPATSPVAARMTFSLPLINAARSVLFVVAGADKVTALQSVRSGAGDLPAARVHARSTRWLVDAAATGEVSAG